MKKKTIGKSTILFILAAVLVGILIVLKESVICTASEQNDHVIDSLSDLNGKRIGIQTGTSFDAAVREKMPEAHLEYYNGKADLLAALIGKKIDAFIVDEAVAQILIRESKYVVYLPEYLDSYDFAPIFPKTRDGEQLRNQFNAFLEHLPEETLDELSVKWFSENEADKTMPDISRLEAKKGVLKLATESGYAPFEYMRDGKVVGYDMELAAMFCEYSGYGLDIIDMNFDGILPAIQTSKCDFALAGISITPERAESVLFSKPNFSGGTVAMILKENAEYNDSFWDSISESFNKTFIRENRWQLFQKGILTTLLITIFAVLFGTALGFVVFMLCRNGNPVANIVTQFFMWLIQGMPMVVLLMILFYVIFGSVAINGVLVAIIGFSLTFGASVFGLLKTGVGAVGIGQYEGAYALGYSERQTFYKIILPQAMPFVLPAYKGEIVSLIKSTAIVGYIAVQDLTKIGDIVRGRTYEAFFPLISITVIYFALETLVGFGVGRISVNINPKRRKESEILKGIKH